MNLYCVAMRRRLSPITSMDEHQASLSLLMPLPIPTSYAWPTTKARRLSQQELSSLEVRCNEGALHKSLTQSSPPRYIPYLTATTSPAVLHCYFLKQCRPPCESCQKAREPTRQVELTSVSSTLVRERISKRRQPEEAGGAIPGRGASAS